MDQIVFFWSGKNLNIPGYFVKSISKNTLGKYKIIQVSDLNTNRIDGVDKFIQVELPKNLMTARLKAFSFVKTLNNRTIFCDADSLMLCDIKLSEFKDGFYIMKRKKNSIINHLYPEHFPEFKNKYFIDLMPFLFGAIIISNKENYFLDLYNICLKLPSRYQRWYGDQISLHMFYLDNKSKFHFFEQPKYMHIFQKNDDAKKTIKYLLERKVPFVTFKGINSKKRINELFNFLN